MAKLIKLDKTNVDKEPYLLWNAFVQLISESEPDDLNDIQSVAQFAFWYDSEVQNGGHLQYFENKHNLYGSEKITLLISATLESLKILGAKEQADILSSASKHYLSQVRKHPKTVQEFSELALEDEFGEFDSNYYNCTPDMNYYLEKYLQSHINEFVESS